MILTTIKLLFLGQLLLKGKWKLWEDFFWNFWLAFVGQCGVGDLLLWVAVHSKSTTPETLFTIINYVSGVRNNISSLIEPQSDEANLGSVNQVESVRLSLFPSSYRYFRFKLQKVIEEQQAVKEETADETMTCNIEFSHLQHICPPAIEQLFHLEQNIAFLLHPTRLCQDMVRSQSSPF